jgi:hypothetical protein
LPGKLLSQSRKAWVGFRTAAERSTINISWSPQLRIVK